jgi:hypothetical protein
MAVPTFHTIVVVDIERFGPRAGQRAGIINNGPTTVHGDQIAGDKIVGSR